MDWAWINEHRKTVKPYSPIVLLFLNVVLILPDFIYTFNNFPSDAPNFPIYQAEFNISSGNTFLAFMSSFCLVVSCLAGNIINRRRRAENIARARQNRETPNINRARRNRAAQNIAIPHQNHPEVDNVLPAPDVDFLLLGLAIFQFIYFPANFIDLYFLDRKYEDSLNVVRFIYTTFVFLSFTIEIVMLKRFEEKEMRNWAVNFAISGIDVGFLFNMSKNPCFYRGLIHLALKLLSLYPIYTLNKSLQQAVVDDDRVPLDDNNFPQQAIVDDDRVPQDDNNPLQSLLCAFSIIHSSVLSSVFSTVNPFINGMIHTNPSQNPDSMFILATLFGLVVPIATYFGWFLRNNHLISRFHVMVFSRLVHTIVLILIYISFDQISFEGLAMKQERLVWACILYSLNIACTVLYSIQLLEYLVLSISNRQGFMNIAFWAFTNVMFWLAFHGIRAITKEKQLPGLISLDLLSIFVFWKLEQIAQNRRREQNNNADGDQPGDKFELWTAFSTLLSKWPNCLAPFRTGDIQRLAPQQGFLDNNQVGNN